ncbi:uncharacterized protein DEA37_0008371 [Paragonimus westermani]|uniref:Uncharacterized protein n=1 Tax=Paragonimus westermani TaxID=34504 RepID=A0A5J4NHM2_9TREM|nr:uncharacterized protein DEA37_0008371 [Paragonimus westermani]
MTRKFESHAGKNDYRDIISFANTDVGHDMQIPMPFGSRCSQRDQSGPELITPKLKVAPLLQKIHAELGHAGQLKTEAAIHQCYWRSGIHADVVTQCSSCETHSDVENHTPSPRAPLEPVITEHPGQRVGVDIMGLLPVESTFALQQISLELIRFHHLVEALPPHVIDEVDDILELPDSTKPYEQLKAAIIKRVGLSDRQRISQPRSASELGGRRPSQLLRHVQRLTGTIHMKEALLEEMWLQRLPKDMQNILSLNLSATLSTLDNVADRIGKHTAPLFPNSH